MSRVDEAMRRAAEGAVSDGAPAGTELKAEDVALSAEKIDTEQLICMTTLNPQPWDAGAVAAILSELADACTGVDWSKPLTAWPKDDIIEFLLKAMLLIRKAIFARDMSGKGITRQSSAATIARQANAAAGGSFMTPDEFNDLL